MDLKLKFHNEVLKIVKRAKKKGIKGKKIDEDLKILSGYDLVKDYIHNTEKYEKLDDYKGLIYFNIPFENLVLKDCYIGLFTDDEINKCFEKLEINNIKPYKNKRFIKVTFSFVLLSFLFIFIYLYLFKDSYSLVHIEIYLAMLLFINAPYKNKAFKNFGHNIKLLTKRFIKIIPVYEVKIIQGTKILKSDYMIISLIIPIAITMFNYFVLLPNWLYNITNNFLSLNTLKIFLPLLLVIILQYEDLYLLIEGFIKYRKSLFIETDIQGKIKYGPREDIKHHHRKIYMMENYDYKNYKYQDLIREKIYLEGKMEKSKKVGFYDAYVLPVLVVVLTSVFTFFVNYYDRLLSDIKLNYSLDVALKDFLLLIFQITAMILVLTFFVKMPSYSNISDLKCRILVIDKLVEAKGKTKSHYD